MRIIGLTGGSGTGKGTFAALLRDKGAGFGTDTNVATLLFADGRRETPTLMPKEELADIILDRLLAMQQSGQ